jgi:hypothetical protein
MEHFREALRREPNLEWVRQGIVEALEVRHWLYRQIPRYFLWMSRLGRHAQWGVLLGLLFAQQVLASAVPLFNLLLRMNRFGLLLLTRLRR